MKTEIIPNKPKERTFPLVAKIKGDTRNLTVLFKNEKEGTVLIDEITYTVGDHNEYWSSPLTSEDWDILDDITINFKS